MLNCFARRVVVLLIIIIYRCSMCGVCVVYSVSYTAVIWGIFINNFHHQFLLLLLLLCYYCFSFFQIFILLIKNTNFSSLFVCSCCYIYPSYE